LIESINELIRYKADIMDGLKLWVEGGGTGYDWIQLILFSTFKSNVSRQHDDSWSFRWIRFKFK
jgi:hypothetical protein